MKRYGLATYDNEGKLWFLSERAITMIWSDETAAVWREPPKHYLKPKNGDFIVNFNKKSSPVILHDRVSRNNYKFTIKADEA